MPKKNKRINLIQLNGTILLILEKDQNLKFKNQLRKKGLHLKLNKNLKLNLLANNLIFMVLKWILFSFQNNWKTLNTRA